MTNARNAGKWLPLGVVFCAALALGWTVPRDDSGNPAAQCSFLGSSGVSTLCSTTDPLPTSAVGPAPAQTTSSTDPTGWAQRWFSGFVSEGTPRPIFALYQSDAQLIGFQASSLPTADVFLSVNKGASWVRIYNGLSFGGQGWQLMSTVVQTAAGVYLLGGDCGVNVTPGCSGMGRWDQAGAATMVALPGIPAGLTGGVVSILQQGTTVLAVWVHNGDGRAWLCRSVDSGATFSCPAANYGTLNLTNGVALASPAANIWIRGTTGGALERSINDGVTWGNVKGGGAATSANPFCLSATTCLAVDSGSNIYRSTNAGATWTTAYSAVLGGPQFSHVINYGSGIAVTVPQISGSSMVITHDAGATWTPVFSTTTDLRCPRPCYSAARAGNAVLSSGLTGSSNQVVIYSPSIGQGTTQLVGAAGYSVEVDSLGNLAVAQRGPVASGTGTLTAPAQTVTIPITPGIQTVGFWVTGVYTGTLLPECSIDGTNFVGCPAVTPGFTQINQFTNTNNGGFFWAGAWASVRIRASALSAGTATVTWRASPGIPGTYPGNTPQLVAPSQAGSTFNSSTTGAANTAVVATLAPNALVPNQRMKIQGFSAYCSAGSASLTVTDNAVTIWQTPAGAVGTGLFSVAFPTALTGAFGTTMTVTLGQCGAGNTGTLNVQGDRY